MHLDEWGPEKYLNDANSISAVEKHALMRKIDMGNRLEKKLYKYLNNNELISDLLEQGIRSIFIRPLTEHIEVVSVVI